MPGSSSIHDSMNEDKGMIFTTATKRGPLTSEGPVRPHLPHPLRAGPGEGGRGSPGVEGFWGGRDRRRAGSEGRRSRRRARHRGAVEGGRGTGAEPEVGLHRGARKEKEGSRATSHSRVIKKQSLTEACLVGKPKFISLSNLASAICILSWRQNLVISANVW
jgi:hypothetical protein